MNTNNDIIESVTQDWLLNVAYDLRDVTIVQSMLIVL